MNWNKKETWCPRCENYYTGYTCKCGLRAGCYFCGHPHPGYRNPEDDNQSICFSCLKKVLNRKEAQLRK